MEYNRYNKTYNIEYKEYNLLYNKNIKGNTK